MRKVKMGKGKLKGIRACANSKGIISAAAMDQRGSLKKSIEKAAGKEVGMKEMVEFKTAVTKILTPHASAILMDPEYGLPTLPHRAPKTGVLLAYEKSGYDVSVKGRLPDLLPQWSVRRLKEAGADAIKILLYYNPFDDQKINAIKQAYIERIGAECEAMDMPFFLEPLAYDDALGDDKGFEFAKKKPEYVARYMEEFSKARYGVDILKVELPFNIVYMEGTSAFKGEGVAYNRKDGLKQLKEQASAAKKPYIFLSAGVSDATFRESLEMAAEAGVPYSGVLCGRATWQEGIPAYGQKGRKALEKWLSDRGVKNIEMLNEVVAKGAKPWWTIYGGKDNIEAV